MVYNPFYILLDFVSPHLTSAGVKRGGEPRPLVSLVTGASQIISTTMHGGVLIFHGKPGGKMSKNDWYEHQGSHTVGNLGVTHQAFAYTSFLTYIISVYNKMTDKSLVSII